MRRYSLRSHTDYDEKYSTMDVLKIIDKVLKGYANGVLRDALSNKRRRVHVKKLIKA
jgi:hypothetical protein